MLSVPACHAEAGSVFALAMFVAPGVTQFTVAEFSTPARIAAAAVTHAASVLATVQVAQFLRAVLSAPLRLAAARLAVQIERSMAGTVRQALQCVLVHRGTVGSLPALLADACALGTESVARAGRMRTIHWRKCKIMIIMTE